MDTSLRLEVPDELHDQRLDRILAALMPEHSRARLQGWIRAGQVQVDGRSLQPKARVPAGAQLCISVPTESAIEAPRPQAIALEVLYEDDELIVINKPPGLVVHPGAGREDGTLLNALLHHRPALEQVARAGIVHRLDKDTSGVLVVAGTPEAHTALVRALQAREVRREYLALVNGRIISGGTIDRPIGRDRRDRKRMGVVANGREAVTHYRVAERFDRATLLAVRLETGRTHQIRVHMREIGHPLAGDRQYGHRGDPFRARIERQALHAWRLGLRHPASGADLSWECDPPADMAGLLQALRESADA